MNQQKGFTLIELMIVVAIVGVLAAVAIPVYRDYLPRSQLTEAMSLADGVKVKVAETFAQDGTCPENGNAGIAAETAIHGLYVAKVSAGGTPAASGGCTIVATIGGGASTLIQNKTVTYTLDRADQGAYTWVCTSNAAQKYVPKTCTGA